MTIDSALLTPGNIQNRFTVLMDDTTLAALIAQEQDAIEDVWGSATAARTTLLQIAKPSDKTIKLPRPISSVASVYVSYTDASSHSDTGTTLLTASEYIVHKKAGNIQRSISGYSQYGMEPRSGMVPQWSEAFPYATPGYGYFWLPSVEITWTPEDDTYARIGALYQLVELAVNRTSLQSEQTRDYSRKADPLSWETQRNMIIAAMARLVRF